MAAKFLKTEAEVRALGRGVAFRTNVSKMTWREKHGVMYCTANKPVVIKMKDGTVHEGRLDEVPGYFRPDHKVWIRQAGRKTRRGIVTADIVSWQGFRAPTFAEAMTAFIVLSANNPTDPQVAEARSVAADM